MSEIWREINGFEGRYSVSNLGRVKAHAHYREGVGRGPFKGQWYKERILKPGVVGSGYLQVQLYRDGKQSHVLVHRLVAEAFIVNADYRPQVNHKDGDKKNNVAENLEWATSKENNEHAMKTGLTLPGSNAYKGKVAIGTVHASFTVIGELTPDKKVLCRCVCGTEKLVSRFNLGRSQKSCGCLRFKNAA